MRFALTFLSLLLSVALLAQVPAADAILQTAYAKAVKENKKVLLIFHASWCGWCRKMDASLSDTSIKEAIHQYYEIVHLTIDESPDKKSLENTGAKELNTKLGGSKSGLPYWVILDSKGTLLANSKYKGEENTGCPAKAEEVTYFIGVLKKTSSLTEKELEAIRIRFRKNEG